MSAAWVGVAIHDDEKRRRSEKFQGASQCPVSPAEKRRSDRVGIGKPRLVRLSHPNGGSLWGRATRANKLRTEVACHGPLRSAQGCTTLPRYSSDDACCWLASQSGHAGQGAMCIAGDSLSTKFNSPLKRGR